MDISKYKYKLIKVPNKQPIEHIVLSSSCYEIEGLTLRIWFSNTLEMAMPCSVFSFAITVRLLISYLEFIVRSSREFL